MQEKERVEERLCEETPLSETPEMAVYSENPSAVMPAQEETSPPAEEGSCNGSCNNGSGKESFIYAIGRIEPRFPSLGVEKEFVQAVKNGKTANFTDRQVLYEILSQEENHYLARELCFVFTVENIETYILRAATRQELNQLVEAIKPTKGIDCDVVIGIRGPMAPAEMCNGLQVPMVLCDRIYSFDVESFINAIPQTTDMPKANFKNAARELFDRMMQLTDNVGEMDEHRAINYAALRYPAIYSLALEMHAADKSLNRLEVQPSRLSGTRKVVNLVFSYVDRKTDVVDKYFTRIDVTEKFPFLVSKLQVFYDR